MIDHDLLVERSYDLEPLSPTIVRLASLVCDRDTSMSEIGEVVSSDPILTGITLRTANSARYGGNIEIGTVGDAVTRLGGGAILDLAIRTSVRNVVNRDMSAYAMSEEDYWRHSYGASRAAELMRRRYCSRIVPAEAQTAALLHDIGKTVLTTCVSRDEVDSLAHIYEQDKETRTATERLLWGVDHAELGGLIAQHWQLPDSIRTGIAFHHEPLLHEDPIVDLVHVADLAASTALPITAQATPEPPADVILERLNMTRKKFAQTCEVLAQEFEEQGLDDDNG